MRQASQETMTGGEKRREERGEELIWVSKHLIKKLPPSKALQAARGASGAEPLRSSSGNESLKVKLKVEAKQLKLD